MAAQLKDNNNHNNAIAHIQTIIIIIKHGETGSIYIHLLVLEQY